MIEEQAIDNPASKVLNPGLIDLRGWLVTLSVRLIQASICERLTASPLLFSIQIDIIVIGVAKTINNHHCFNFSVFILNERWNWSHTISLRS